MANLFTDPEAGPNPPEEIGKEVRHARFPVTGALKEVSTHYRSFRAFLEVDESSRPSDFLRGTCNDQVKSKPIAIDITHHSTNHHENATSRRIRVKVP